MLLNVSSSIIEGGVNRIRGFDLYSYNGGILQNATGKVGAVAGFNDSLALAPHHHQAAKYCRG